MNIPPKFRENFWQASVKTAEDFFKCLPEEEPLMRRKILETIFARFCYETTLSTLDAAGPDPAQWEQDLNNELEMFRSLLLGLVDPSFSMAFRVLEGGNVDGIALKRKEEYYEQLLNSHRDPFLAPVIEICSEIDRRWFIWLWEKHGIATPDSFLLIASKGERMQRVGKLVLAECQMVLDSLKLPPE